MQRFFVPPETLVATDRGASERERTAMLTGKEFHYLSRVRRLKLGDRLPACTIDGSRYLMTVTNIGRDHLQVSLLLTDERKSVPPLPLNFAQAVVKPLAMDLIIRQATELGVVSIVPVITERSAPSRYAQPRLPRWQRIARNATQQCGREQLPAIEEPRILANLLSAIPVSASKLLFHPPEVTATPIDLPPMLDPTTQIWVLVGPEGGFSNQELERIASAGFRRCALGTTVLRSETAAVAAITATRLLLYQQDPEQR